MKYEFETTNCLRQKIAEIRKTLNVEKDNAKRKKLEIKIKICELKIMIANIK